MESDLCRIFDSKSEAMKREKHLKTGVGREFIQKLISNNCRAPYPPRRTLSSSLRRGGTTKKAF
jgi:hypothetical protein